MAKDRALMHNGIRDAVLLGVTLLAAAFANLPDRFMGALVLDRRWLVGALILMVCIALVRYVEITLVLLISVLAIGANLPAEAADALHVDPQIMLLGLVVTVAIALSNRYLQMPDEAASAHRMKSAHGGAALFNAVLKGRIGITQMLLRQGVDVDVRTSTGKTALMAAAYKGYGDLVQILIDSGANLSLRDNRGETALSVAERAGYVRVVEILKKAGAG